MQWNVVNHLKSCISHGWATPVQSAMLKVHLCMSSCYLVIFSLHINNWVKQHYAILEALLFFCNFKWQKIVESSFKNSVWDLQNLYFFFKCLCRICLPICSSNWVQNALLWLGMHLSSPPNTQCMVTWAPDQLWVWLIQSNPTPPQWVLGTFIHV